MKLLSLYIVIGLLFTGSIGSSSPQDWNFNVVNSIRSSGNSTFDFSNVTATANESWLDSYEMATKFGTIPTNSFTFRYNLASQKFSKLLKFEMFLQNSIQRVFSTSDGKTILSILTNSGIEEIDFVVHLVRQTERKYDSWTHSKMGSIKIHLFLSNLDYFGRNIDLIIAHELAQIAIGNSFGKVGLLVEKYFGQIPTRFSEMNYSQDYKFNMFTATFRAFAVELGISKQLGLKNAEFEYTGQQCVESLQKLYFKVLNIVHVQNNLKFYRTTDNKLLLEFGQNLRKSGRSVEFCEELAKLPIEDNFCVFPGGGPRPSTIGDP